MQMRVGLLSAIPPKKHCNLDSLVHHAPFSLAVNTKEIYSNVSKLSFGI